MALSTLAFTGVSSYSSDLQQVLTRAVKIASLPIQALQNDQATLLSRKSALSSIGLIVDGLASSLETLGNLGDDKAMGVSSSNSGTVTAEVDGEAPAGVYSITSVDSIAETAVAATTQVYATAGQTAVAGAGKYLELVVNGATHVFNLTDETDNLNSIRDLINASDAGLNASVINTGSGYALSVSGRETGAKTIQLWTGVGGTGVNLLSTVTPGADAEFVLNGQTITSSSNRIEDVIPGVAFTLRDTTAPGETATLSVASDPAQVAGALQEFVSAYNRLRAAVSEQSIGSDGVLGGSAVLVEIQRQLQSITSAQGTGSVATLADLGLTFNDEGVLSLDSSVVFNLSPEDLASAFDFLGASNNGLGSLAASLSGLTDPLDGIIHLEQDSIDQADSRLAERIATMMERLERMQLETFQRLQMADALLSKLESQQGMLDASLASLKYIVYGKQED